MIRPNAKLAKIAYNILKTPKNARQKSEPNPPEALRKEWFKDSSTAQ